MNTHIDKAQVNKSQFVTNNTFHKQRRGESTVQFVDNRPEAIAQRKLQEMANNSPRVKQLMTFQETGNNNKQSQQGAQLNTIQRLENGDTVVQLAENDVKFCAFNPARVSTTSGLIYLLEGNEKYGEMHAEKHSQEIKNVAARRGWTGSISEILMSAISESKYTAYQKKDDRGSTVNIPVTARKMIVIAIADDGKIITAMIQPSDSKAIKLFWDNGSSEIRKIGWDIVGGKDPRKLEDAPWDLYQK